MALLRVLHFPDPALRVKAVKVDRFDKSLAQLADNMLETMYNEGGIGLAATQVGIAKRVVVMDLSEERNDPRVFINPEVTPVGESCRDFAEACLSVPGESAEISRPENVLIRYRDLQGEPHEANASELLAVCIQHECDHLDGKLFIDYLTLLQRQRIRKKLSQKKELI